MRFAFDKNWQSYSANALTAQRIEQARRAFGELLAGIDVQQKRFVDIGFGQSLSLVVAAKWLVTGRNPQNDALLISEKLNCVF